jgi:hypothetical protein
VWQVEALPKTWSGWRVVGEPNQTKSLIGEREKERKRERDGGGGVCNKKLGVNNKYTYCSYIHKSYQQV